MSLSKRILKTSHPPNGTRSHHECTNPLQLTRLTEASSSQSPSSTRNADDPAASSSTRPSSAQHQDTDDDMKRAVAKKLIEQYFYQLSNGCGNPSCSNSNCASSGQVASLTPNQAAARAIQLYTQEAELCDVHPSKIARTQSETTTTVDKDETAAKDCAMIEVVDRAEAQQANEEDSASRCG